MKKEILLCCFLLSSCGAYEAQKIEAHEYEQLKTLEKELYDMSCKKVTYNIAEVANLIFNNLAYKLDYTLLKIESSATARAMTENKSTTLYTSESDKLSAQITLTYPLLDQKEDMERQKKIIETRQEIVKETKKYFDSKLALHALQIELKKLFMLEVRAKSRKLTAVDSFDNWLKVVDDIQKTNEKISNEELKLFEAKELLLSLVKPHAHESVKALL